MLISFSFSTLSDKSFKGDEMALKQWALDELREVIDEIEIDDEGFEVEYDEEELLDFS